MLLPPMVCSASLLVVGGQVKGSRLCVRGEGYFLRFIEVFDICLTAHP